MVLVRIVEMMHLGVWKGSRRMESVGVLSVRESRGGPGISHLEKGEGIKEQGEKF